MYTKGPWTVFPEECDKPYIRIRGSVLGGRYKIANVLTPVYDGVLPREAEETRANAKLIAAAPDLLEALQNIVVTADKFFAEYNVTDEGECIKAARKAIAKAT